MSRCMARKIDPLEFLKSPQVVATNTIAIHAEHFNTWTDSKRYKMPERKQTNKQCRNYQPSSGMGPGIGVSPFCRHLLMYKAFHLAYFLFFSIWNGTNTTIIPPHQHVHIIPDLAFIPSHHHHPVKKRLSSLHTRQVYRFSNPCISTFVLSSFFSLWGSSPGHLL